MHIIIKDIWLCLSRLGFKDKTDVIMNLSWSEFKFMAIFKSSHILAVSINIVLMIKIFQAGFFYFVLSYKHAKSFGRLVYK